MSIPVETLLKRVPRDTLRRVEQVKSRFNTTIRRLLREETALKLSGGSDADNRTSVPVRLARGLPRGLAGRRLDDDTGLAVTLAPHQHTLRRLRENLDALKPALSGLAQRLDGRGLVGDRVRHVGPVRELAALLLHEAEKADLVRWMLEVDEDVLGVYEYGCIDGFPESSIELYWSVIGVCAGWLGAPVEDLAVVVLTHELAHAYTHLGRDIDGLRWASASFGESDRTLKEGLAQYYTPRVCHRLTVQLPGCRAVYETLLPRQPRAYRTHLSWIADCTPEEVRYAMLAVRCEARASLEDFELRLEGARRAITVTSGRLGLSRKRGFSLDRVGQPGVSALANQVREGGTDAVAPDPRASSQRRAAARLPTRHPASRVDGHDDQPR